MKKLILLALSFVALNAQIGVEYDADVKGNFVADSTFANEDTLFLYGDSEWVYDANSAGAFFNITNNSGASMDISLKRTEVNVVTNTKNNTCWVTCPANYLSAGDQVVYLAPTMSTLAAGASDLTFAPKFKANGTQGISIIRYTFFDDANPNDSLAIVIVYNHQTAASIATLDLKSFTMAPNPAQDYTAISFEALNNENVRLDILDLNGKVILSQNNLINQGLNQIRVETSALPQGVYLLQINGKDGFYNEKLVVE